MLVNKNLIAYLAVGIFLIILGYELFYSKPHEIPSPLIGEALPSFKLNTINKQGILSNKSLPHRPLLINIWATWCYACQIEYPQLMKIARDEHTPIYSIVYKDNAAKVQQWFKKYGNPYVLTGDDANGNVAIDLGVYGTPETFVIDANGKVVYKHIGVIDSNTWNNILKPLLRKLSSQ